MDAVTATPTTGDAMASSTRVLLCVGSESGNTKRLATRTVKAWIADGAKFTIDTMTVRPSPQSGMFLCGASLTHVRLICAGK